jgi:hypothetical protein
MNGASFQWVHRISEWRWVDRGTGELVARQNLDESARQRGATRPHYMGRKV